MADYISCASGHYFNKDMYAECPFCKGPGGQVPPPITRGQVPPPITGGPEDDGKTKVDATSQPSGKKEATQVEVTSEADRTRIVRPSESNSGSEDAEQDQERRIVGWLVTFDDVPSGVDHRIREGQNPVGRNADCKVRVSDDPEMSGRHGMLLYREGGLWFKDEMASNATVIDGKAVGPGQTVEVKDGAHLKMGSYTYLYRAAGA